MSYVFNRDRDHQFLFAPLQGEAAKKHLDPALIKDLSTVVFYDQGQILIKAEAAREILKRLGGLSGLLAQAAQFVPPFLQIKFYDSVASNRYSIFGQLETCRVPASNEKEYFLD